MKFVWKEHDLVIHGEGSHSNGYLTIVDEVSQGCDFYTVEMVNAIGDDLAPQPLMPFVYKKIPTIMQKSSFKLEKNSRELSSLSKFPPKEQSLVWGMSPQMRSRDEEKEC